VVHTGVFVTNGFTVINAIHAGPALGGLHYERQVFVNSDDLHESNLVVHFRIWYSEVYIQYCASYLP